MGVMMFVHESPIRNTACVASGVKPSSTNMGTNTGARMAHLADALVMSRLSVAANATNTSSSGAPESPTLFRNDAPETAMIDSERTVTTCSGAASRSIGGVS